MAQPDLFRLAESMTNVRKDHSLAHSHNNHGTVLIVDDEPFILRVLARMLENSTYTVVSCQLPSQAIDCLSRGDVVLVVSDMTMPEMSGLELMRKIRQRDEDMPVVLMTGRSDSESIVEALECGASEYLIKPFDISKFRQTVQRLARPPRHFQSDSQVRLLSGSAKPD
jgi:DNA-binding NtrC family response regulator